MPFEAIVINFVNRRSKPNREYCLRDIERDLLDQLIGEQFSKAFLILHVIQYLYRIPNKRVFEIYGTKFGMVIYRFKGIGPA